MFCFFVLSNVTHTKQLQGAKIDSGLELMGSWATEVEQGRWQELESRRPHYWTVEKQSEVMLVFSGVLIFLEWALSPLDDVIQIGGEPFFLSQIFLETHSDPSEIPQR